MTTRVTVAMSLLVDLTIDTSADLATVIRRLNCQCFDTTGEASVVGVEISGRNLVADTAPETSAS